MGRLVVVLCAAEVLTMISVFAFPAALPLFLAEWGLSNTDAGWINGIYFGGYALAVPVLVGLTDRVDARRIYLLGAGLAALSAFGFALLAQGFWTALLLRLLGGIGLAGTYMPGLRALVDRCGGPHQPRAIAFYTSSFSLGTSLSFLLVGALAETVGWRPAFAAAGCAAALAALLVAPLAPVPPKPLTAPGRLLDFRPVLRNRRAMAYILAYGSHCWELFGMRGWMVAFLAFVLAGQHTGGWSPTAVVTFGALVAMAASIFGADLAVRLDRRRVIAAAMVLSGAGSLVIGHLAALPYALVAVLSVVYAALIQIDSAALTTGALQEAVPAQRGATMALHSLVGFTAALLGPLVVGLVLDRTGGITAITAWGLAFGSLGVVALLGPLPLLWLRR